MAFLDDYEPVDARIQAFWADHPKGRITTVLVEHADGSYIFRSEVYRELDPDGEPAATGYAHDSEATLPANMKSSALEVCETSAIGRALASLGYAPKGKRPSREEMSKAGVDTAHPSPALEGGVAAPPTTSVTEDRGSTGALNAGNGAGKGGGEPDGEAGPTTLDLLYRAYGNGNKVLMAARKLYADVGPPNQLTDLTEERMQELLERAGADA